VQKELGLLLFENPRIFLKERLLSMIRTLVTLALVSTLIILNTGSALALGLPIGPRVGYTSWDGIQQMHFGAHAKTGDLFPNVELTPGIEMGFGDDVTLITLNGDLVYRFTELSTDPWGFNAGGSLSLNYIDHKLSDGNLDLGFSGLIGVTRKLGNGNELLAEIRLGILDSPDFKATIGYTFF
jgi:hypothetical protein